MVVEFAMQFVTLTLSWVGFGRQCRTSHPAQGAPETSTFETALDCDQQLQKYSWESSLGLVVFLWRLCRERAINAHVMKIRGCYQ